MNKTLETLYSHVSVRSFEGTILSAETKDQLLRAAQSGSSSNFVQAYSLLDITDPGLRETLADITNSAAYVKESGAFYIFVADLYRQAVMLEKAGKPLDGIRTMESLMVAIVDATIAAQSFAVAAESMGLGICFIGGIRNDIRTVAKQLNLPKFTVPLLGLTVGTPLAKNGVKPRLPKKNVYVENTYDKKTLTDLHDYDAIMRTYYSERDSNAADTDFTQKMTEFFSVIRRKEVDEFLKEQGFRLE